MRFLVPFLFVCLSLPLFSHAATFGEVKLVKGKALLGVSPLKVGTKVSPDDVITTGPKTIVRILLDEGIAMQIGPDSTVRLDKTKDNPTTLELLKGYLLSKIKPGPSDGKTKYRVRTRTAALGVRGTTFFAKEEKDGRTFLCVCSGKVEARWVRGGVAITTKNHEARWISQESPATEPAADMGKDHSDADIAALQKLIDAKSGGT